jgi:tetratricopeptide (TPR) repeat protein
VINLLALAVAKKDTAAVAALSQELESLRPGARQAREVSAQGALAAGDWNGALRHLEQLAASEPLLEDWAYALAWCQFQAGRLRECAARLEAILEGNPTYGPAHMLAAALAEREDPASAIPHYEKAARTLARPAAAWWNLARLYAAAGDPAGSREAANALRGLNSMPAETAYASGLVSLAESNARQAVSDFREALRQRPEWPEARWNLGLALWSAGDAAAAVESFLAAFGRLSTLPREPLIAALVEQGDFAAAAAEIEELADPTGLPPQLIFNAALGLHRAGVMEQAETLYRLALESEDAMPEASVNLGHVLLASGRPGEANACWESVRG